MSEDRYFDITKAPTVEELDAQLEWGRRERKPFLGRAYQCLSFLAGVHHSAFERDAERVLGRKLEPPPNCDTLVTDNHIPIYLRQLMSMASDGLSDFKAIPAGPEPYEIEAANLATKFLKWREIEDKEDQLREDELLWVASTMEAYRKTYYDPDATDSTGTPGDIRTEIIPMFRMIKCPDDQDQWPPRWVCECDARSIDWMREQYGSQAKDLKPEALADETIAMNALTSNVVTDRDFKYSHTHGYEQKNSVLRKVMYVQPHKKFPRGAVIIWAGGKIMKIHDFPAGVFPITRAGWMPVPGRLYPLGFIEMLLSDQQSLDVILSQMATVRDRQVRGDALVRGGTPEDIFEEVVDPETGRKIIMMSNAVQDWEWINYQVPLDLVQFEVERVRQNMHDKAGQAQPLTGKLADEKRTATEMQLVREAGFAGVAFHLRRYERSCCEVAEIKMALAKDSFAVARELPADVLQPGESRYLFGSMLGKTAKVRSEVQPKLTPAMKRVAIDQITQMRLNDPSFWLNPKTGMIDPLVMFACRQAIRLKGLNDHEDELAAVYGSYEELQQLVGQMVKTGVQLHLQMLTQHIQQAMMGQGQQAGAGQMDSAGMMPDAGSPVDQVTPVPTDPGMPAIPADAGATPTDYVMQ